MMIKCFRVAQWQFSCFRGSSEASAGIPAEIRVYNVDFSPFFHACRLRYEERQIMTPAAADVVPMSSAPRKQQTTPAVAAPAP